MRHEMRTGSKCGKAARKQSACGRLFLPRVESPVAVTRNYR
ncbi:MAG: hypothetical protein RR622_06325 [Hydrogenoanaerobacterium sp.]